MQNYRRHHVAGGCYFFTVNLLERHKNQLLIQHINILRQVVRQILLKYPFHIDGWVVLPEHMHCIWTLPEGDDDYATRIRLIKSMFSKQMPKIERRSAVRQQRGERGIWQRRYWEHFIQDDNDYARHMDYLHFNPVKHGYVRQVKDWPYSTFRKLVRKGVYPENWAGSGVDINVGESG